MTVWGKALSVNSCCLVWRSWPSQEESSMATLRQTSCCYGRPALWFRMANRKSSWLLLTSSDTHAHNTCRHLVWTHNYLWWYPGVLKFYYNTGLHSGFFPRGGKYFRRRFFMCMLNTQHMKAWVQRYSKNTLVYYLYVLVCLLVIL